MKLAAILTHGIGVHDKNWAQETIAQLELKILKKINSYVPGKAPAKAKDAIDIYSFEWDEIFYERQMILYGVLTAQSKPHVIPVTGAINPIAGIGIFLSGLFTKWILKTQAKVASQFVADILAYLNPEASALVNKKLQELLAEAGKSAHGAKTPITFISHSLGTVITSNFIYDRTKGGKPFDRKLILENFFTVGAPIALFSLRYDKDPEAFSSPVHMEASAGRWLNIFDDDDPVGMQLKGLNKEYGKAVHQDVQVDVGPYGLSHTAYLSNPAVLDVIATKLALDWVRHNDIVPLERQNNLLREFDLSLGINSKSGVLD